MTELNQQLLVKTEKMKMTKCKMTVSGKHIWIDDVWDVLTGEESGSIKYTFPYKYIECQACGLIDDIKTKKLNDRT